MGRRGWLACVIAMALATTALAAAPAMWTHVSVLQAAGGRLDDVALTWALDGFLLEAMAADGKVTTLSPDQVRQVLSFDHRDLTDEIGAACPAKDIDFHLLGSLKHVPFRFVMMMDAGAGLALSNVNGGGTAHGTLLAGLRLGLGERVHMRMGFRRQRASEATTAEGHGMAADTREFLALLGFRLTPPRDNNNYAYLEGGVSVVHTAQRFDSDGSVLGGADLTSISPTLQGGVVLPLDKQWGVDLGGFVASRASLDAVAGQTVLTVGATAALTWRGFGN